MNNIFQINRFGKVLSKELKEYFPKYGSFELSLLAGYVLYYVIKAIFGDSPADPSDRIVPLMIFVMTCCFAAPFKLYGNANDKKLGITYAMLPASSLEKFLSMLINTVIVTTVGFTAAIFCLDTILSLIPLKSGFAGTLFCGDIFNAENIKMFFSIMLMQSAFFFGNLLFMKHKVSNTLLYFIALHFLIIVLVAIGFKVFGFSSLNMADGTIMMDGKPFDSEEFYGSIEVVAKICFYLYSVGLPLAFYALSYYKIKTQKY